jgi:flavin-dependent dehydrogenase
MPVRATTRGAQRTPLHGEFDVLICGASFAGLTVARELEGSGANVLMIDRYEIGERQTSACGAPTEWLVNMGLQRSILQTFSELVIHLPRKTFRWRMPWTFSTFDYRHLCALLRDGSPSTRFETAKVERRDGDVVHTDRGALRAPLIVDALGWRRMLSNTVTVTPPDARMSRGLEVHPPAAGGDLEIWIDPRYVRAGYSWAFPAHDEVRIGVGSFRPHDHVRDPTVRLARDKGLEPLGFQGNWIPHELRAATEDGVFFTGDSAGHCIPMTAEGIRTAFYFGIACGRELRDVLAGERTREQALASYDAFSEAHRWKFRWMLRLQDWVGKLTSTPLLTVLVRLLDNRRFIEWSFGHYRTLTPPEVGLARPARGATTAAPAAHAA